MELHQIKETPFSVAEKKGKFIIIAGNMIMSKKEFKTKEDATKYVQKKPYELIVNLICLVEKHLSKEVNNE